MKLSLALVLIFTNLFLNNICALAQSNNQPLAGGVSDPFVEAQEKLLHAKGSYKAIRQQENAIEDMRKATRLSLKAAALRAKAEKLQTRADILINKANQQALSRGLYITNPLGPLMMQPPPQAAQQTAKAPMPGQPINLIFPKQEEVSYDQNESAPPVPGY